MPLGAWAGSVIDWQWVFVIISIAATLLAVWITVALPDVPGQAPAATFPLRRVVTLAGIRHAHLSHPAPVDPPTGQVADTARR